MDRGVSTVLDIGLACLLVTASATILVGTPVAQDTPPDADRVGRAVLLSTITVQEAEQTIETSVSDILYTAAIRGSLARDVEPSIRARTRHVHRYTSITVTPGGTGGRVKVGHAPPRGATVDAAIFRVGASRALVARDASGGPEVTDALGASGESGSETPSSDSTITIVVRTWSP